MEPDKEIQSLERVRPKFSYAPMIEHAFEGLPELKSMALENNVDFKEILESREALKNELFINHNLREKSVSFPELSVYSLRRIFKSLAFNSLVEIVGDVNTSQSQFTMFLAMEFAYIGMKVNYIDAKLSFSRDLIKKWNRLKHNENTDYLSNINVIRIFDYQSLMDYLEEYHQNTSNHNSVLIIDELIGLVLSNNLYNPENEWRSRDKGETLFDNIYFTLGDIAYRFNVLTILNRIDNEKVTKKLRIPLSEYEQINATIKILGDGNDCWQIRSTNIFEEIILEVTIIH